MAFEDKCENDSKYFLIFLSFKISLLTIGEDAVKSFGIEIAMAQITSKSGYI